MHVIFFLSLFYSGGGGEGEGDGGKLIIIQTANNVTLCTVPVKTEASPKSLLFSDSAESILSDANQSPYIIYTKMLRLLYFPPLSIYYVEASAIT